MILFNIKWFYAQDYISNASQNHLADPTFLTATLRILLCRVTVIKYTALRRIFGPRKDEVTGEWRRLHNEELNDLYSSPNTVQVIKSRRMRWAGHVARMGEERGVYRVLVVKTEGRRTLERPTRRWVDNIRTDLQEVGCGYMDWIGLAQNRDRWRTLVSAVMNLRVPWNAGNLTSCKPVSFSRRTLHLGVSKYSYNVKFRGCTNAREWKRRTDTACPCQFWISR